MAKDLFSGQAEDYALYRPAYPEELFTYILSFVTEKDVAWDCATGNGQSALPLSQYFEKVFASDISRKQLEQAPKKENIEYGTCIYFGAIRHFHRKHVNNLQPTFKNNNGNNKNNNRQRKPK